jgi:acyl carrier protein
MLGRLSDWMSRFGLKVLKPVVVGPTDATSKVVFETVQMFIDEKVKVSDGLTFADRAVFEDDDPSDIAGMLETSFQIRIPRNEFKSVHTVGDMVQLFERYRTPGK